MRSSTVPGLGIGRDIPCDQVGMYIYMYIHVKQYGYCRNPAPVEIYENIRSCELLTPCQLGRSISSIKSTSHIWSSWSSWGFQATLVWYVHTRRETVMGCIESQGFLPILLQKGGSIHVFPSLKLTASSPLKWMVGKWIFFFAWPIFLGGHLVTWGRLLLEFSMKHRGISRGKLP